MSVDKKRVIFDKITLHTMQDWQDLYSSFGLNILVLDQPEKFPCICAYHVINDVYRTIYPVFFYVEHATSLITLTEDEKKDVTLCDI